MEIIDGKLVSSAVKEDLKEKIAAAYEKYGKKFRLSVIIVGNDPASEIYVRNKRKACEAVGIESDTIALDDNADDESLQSLIKSLAADESVDGILGSTAVAGRA